MPPRVTRGGGPQKRQQQVMQQQQQQQQQPQQQQQHQHQPPQLQQQPPHPNQPAQMHHFHQPTTNYQRPYVTGGTADRGGYGGNPGMGQQQPPPPPQQQQQGNWGGNGYSNNGPNSANNSMYGNAPPSQQHMQQMHQPQYGEDMGYDPNSVHSTPYPQQGSANNRQQQQQQRRTPNPSMNPQQGGGAPYYNNNGNQVPPPPPQQQQQQQQPQGGGYGSHGPPPPHMEPSPSYSVPPQQGVYNDGTGSSSPPSPNYRGGGGSGGGSGMRGANSAGNANSNYAGGGGYGPPSPPPHNGMNNVQPQGMYGGAGGSGNMVPPSHQHQQWAPPQSPQSGYNSAPPPAQMSLNATPQHQQQQMDVPPQQQQQQQQQPPQGRGRGGGMRGGRGAGGGGGQQQQQQQQQQQHQGMPPHQQHMNPVIATGPPPPPPQQQQQQPPTPHYQHGASMMHGPQQPMAPQQGPPQVGMYGPPPGAMGGAGGPMMPGVLPQGGVIMGAGPGGLPYDPRGGVAQVPPPQMLPGQTEFTTIDAANEIGFFYNFLKHRRLLKPASLDKFMPPNYDPSRDGPVKMAIDGNYMVSYLRGRMQQADPLWFLHSVLPDMLLELVNSEVSKMRERNLEPIWVFQGIGTSGDVEAFLPSKDELLARDSVWETLTRGDLPAAEGVAEAFDASSSIGGDVLMAIQRFLRNELNVMAVTAPFLNWCQMATFHHEGDAYLMVGPPEMLIVPYDPMQVIVEIDLDTKEVAYFDREEVVKALFPDFDPRAGGDRLLDFGLLVATHSTLSTSRAQLRLNYEDIYAELSNPTPHYPSLKSFIAASVALEPNSNRDTERAGAQALKHAKGRTYVTCSAVFSKKTPDTPLVYFKRVLNPELSNRNMPNNLSGVFGNFLPISLFYFQYVGLLSVDMMTIVAQSYFRDDMPVSDSKDYQDFLPRLVALRSQTLFQIVQQLNASHRSRLEKVSWVRWFEMVLVLVTTPAETIILDEWDVSNSDRADEINRVDLQNVSIDTVMSLQPRIPCVPLQPGLGGGGGGGGGGAHSAAKYYHTTNETYFGVMLKTFDFLGYFSHNTPEEDMDEYRNPIDGNDALVNAESNELVQSSRLRGDNGEPVPRIEETVSLSTTYLIRTLQNSSPEFHSALIRLSEMARIKLLNALPCSYILADQHTDDITFVEDTEDAPEVLLASRIACLISIPYLDRSFAAGEESKFEWAPVYSRHLCTFSVIVRAMNRDLRELVEVIATTVFISGHSESTLDDFASLIPYLPFGDVPSTIGALLLHYVLVFPPDYEKRCSTPQERCDYLQSKFKSIPNLSEQLRRVMTFTFHALYFLNAYRRTGEEENPLSPELAQIGASESTMDIIDETLKLMHDKWEQHLEGPAPVDVHGLWSMES